MGHGAHVGTQRQHRVTDRRRRGGGGCGVVLAVQPCGAGAAVLPGHSRPPYHKHTHTPPHTHIHARAPPPPPGLGLGLWGHPGWLWLSVVVATFLLQHAVQGWCPPMPVFRLMGTRTGVAGRRQRRPGTRPGPTRGAGGGRARARRAGAECPPNWDRCCNSRTTCQLLQPRSLQVRSKWLTRYRCLRPTPPPPPQLGRSATRSPRCACCAGTLPGQPAARLTAHSWRSAWRPAWRCGVGGCIPTWGWGGQGRALGAEGACGLGGGG